MLQVGDRLKASYDKHWVFNCVSENSMHNIVKKSKVFTDGCDQSYETKTLTTRFEIKRKV